MEQKLIDLQQALQSARNQIEQLESRLKSAETQRDTYATTVITLNNGRHLSVAQWQDEVRQFVNDYQTGKTYKATDIIDELESLDPDSEAFQETGA